jgi:hypothetical protein
MTEREVYKGIEFVRISTLPKEQGARINASFPKEKIFKILREDDVMLNDCIQYHDYQDWFKKFNQPTVNGIAIKPENVRNGSHNLTIK